MREWSSASPASAAHSLAATLITVLFRQELQLLHPPWIAPHVLCVGKSRELREEPAWKNGR